MGNRLCSIHVGSNEESVTKLAIYHSSLKFKVSLLTVAVGHLF